MAIGYPKSGEVISGMRTTCDMFIEIDIEKAMKDGIEFFESKNKVVLSSGINGVIPRVHMQSSQYRNISRKLFIMARLSIVERRRSRICWC